MQAQRCVLAPAGAGGDVPGQQVLVGRVHLHRVRGLAAVERYSYVFEGNSQVLDQVLFSPNLVDQFLHVYDVVHVNSEFADAVQASDHEPSVVRIDLRGRPAP